LSAAADDRIAQFDVVGADERFGDEAIAHILAVSDRAMPWGAALRGARRAHPGVVVSGPFIGRIRRSRILDEAFHLDGAAS
jgi:hypothetical protein